MIFSGSLFTNSNWFAFEDGKTVNEGKTGVAASPSPNTEEADVTDGVVNDKVIGDGSADCGTSEVPTENSVDNSSLSGVSKDLKESAATEIEKPPEWVEWRGSSDSLEPTGVTNSEESSDAAADSTKVYDAATDSTEVSDAAADSTELSDAAANADTHKSIPESSEKTDATAVPVAPASTDININELSRVDDTPLALPNDESKVELDSNDNGALGNQTDESSAGNIDDSPSSADQLIDVEKSSSGGSPEPGDSDTPSSVCPSEINGTSSSSSNVDKPAETEVAASGAAELEVDK